MLKFLISRYVVFFLQFVFSIILASKLDPYHLGIWSFALLLLNYINQFDFGITHAFNVLISQNKGDFNHSNSFYSNSLFLIVTLGLVIISLSIFTILFPVKILVKYDIHHKIILIGIIGALQYVNNLFMTLYRINSSYKEITFNQSINVVLSFLIFFIDADYWIINTLFIVYIASNLLSLFIYVKNSSLKFNLKEIQKKYLSIIMKKAGLLFIFNSSAYLIIISTRSFISSYYPVKDFGVFSLAFSLANAFFLLISTIGFIIYPTILSSFSESSTEELSSKYRLINKKYLLSSHLILYLSIPLFFICQYFFVKYDGLFDNLTFISLALLINAHSFTSTTLLVAMKKELNVAIISLLSFLFNLIGCFVFINYFNIEFKYVIFITTFANLLLSILCGVLVNRKFIGEIMFVKIINDIFPYTLLIPYLLYVVVSILFTKEFLIFPAIIFLLANRFTLIELYHDLINYIKQKQIHY